MTREKVIVNGEVYLDGEFHPATIQVDAQGRISGISRQLNIEQYAGVQTIDASGCLILPGMIDIHAHMQDGAETFFAGTCAAARGGVTTVIDMPPFQSVIDAHSAAARAAWGERECVIDFGLTGGIIIDEVDLERLSELRQFGVAQFKLFMLSRPPSQLVWRAVQKAAETGIRITVHAEEPVILSPVDWDDPLGFPKANPAAAENVAAVQVMEMARAAGAPIHICHVSSARTVELIDAYKGWGVDVTAETAPQYLLLDDSAFSEFPQKVIATPVIKQAEDSAALWQGLRDGVIDALISDHFLGSPLSVDRQKQKLQEIEPGIPGIEVMYPLVYHYGVTGGRLPLQRLVAVTAEKPAQLMGLAFFKGAIRQGMDADLVFLDVSAAWEAQPTSPDSAIGVLPYQGWKLGCRVARTLMRGETVWDGSAICVERGFGSFTGNRHRGTTGL